MKLRVFPPLAACLFLAGAAGSVVRDEPIRPIEPARIDNPALVELGKQLFFDPRLSKSGFLSCNSCHNLSLGGTDNLPTSIGDHWQRGPINSPTVLNSSLGIAQFWDGRAANLVEQAGGPIANPGEMAFSHTLAVEVLSSIPEYQRAFERATGSGTIDMAQIQRAIAAFEETLTTPNARFDQWLRGDDRALTADELAGYRLFKETGCTSCHNGAAVGDSSFQKMGVRAAYVTSNPKQGRYDVTGNDADRMWFKVPTLRNVELTYPYFHDGAVRTLPEAVRTMAHVQLARDLTPAETAQVVAFLATLTGEQPSFALPILPRSTASTPAPQPFD